jgi:predicted permease
MPIRLVCGLGLFVGSLAVGLLLGRRGILSERRAAHVVRWIAKWPSPVVLCLLFWEMDLGRVEVWLLPLLGAVISSATLIPAWLYAKWARLSAPQTGSVLTCAFFSNLGYLGAFSAFALFGEAGYGLCMVYLVFFTPCFYTLGFWISARYGRSQGPVGMGAAFSDELRLYPFLGMLVGGLLNVLGLPRPPVLEWLNQVLIPLDTAAYLIAIGSQLKLESPRPWLGACLVMSAIKFLYTPLVAWVLTRAAHLEGLPRTIVVLQASTPVAVSALVLPLIFGLDRRLSNALWLWTTVWSIPWFLCLLPLLSHLP